MTGFSGRFRVGFFVFFFTFPLTRFPFGRTARVRVRELEGAGQQRPQVGYAQQHQRHAEQRVHHGHDFAFRRFRCQITVAWKQHKNKLHTRTRKR